MKEFLYILKLYNLQNCLCAETDGKKELIVLYILKSGNLMKPVNLIDKVKDKVSRHFSSCWGAKFM